MKTSISILLPAFWHNPHGQRIIVVPLNKRFAKETFHPDQLQPSMPTISSNYNFSIGYLTCFQDHLTI